MATHTVAVHLLAPSSPSDKLLALAAGFPVKCYDVFDWSKPVRRPLCRAKLSGSRLNEVSLLGLTATRVV